jgi:hypothetical protein
MEVLLFRTQAVTVRFCRLALWLNGIGVAPLWNLGVAPEVQVRLLYTPPGRLAQRESASLTSKKSLVRIQ